ncbi:MAG: glutamate 5-kinase [Paracoccaceae bacterium]|nr:glutamate 5-kinase [Paracoccaceae bacterium]
MITNEIKKLAETKFKNAGCIVIKIGSALLFDKKTNSLRLEWLESIASDVNRLRSEGKKVVIVSSGSIALGRKILNLEDVSLSLEESQAAAAVGQILLAQYYQRCLERHGIISAQILVTAEDSQNRRRYLNSRATLVKLLEMGAVPIVNENDTVATDEIRFGDNDRLAAQVASLCDANVLLLLSDVDGLYTSDPNLNLQAKHVPIVEKITEQIEMMASDKKSELSKGGMLTKLQAAKVSVAAGCHMVIANGGSDSPILAISQGQKSTWFLSSDTPIDARKQWIFNTKPKGEIFIDLGAEKAILNGKSLLPAGVTKITGQFVRGDTVTLITMGGKFLARGLIGYSHKDVELIKGCHSSKIETILRHPGRSVLIHRNDMTL